jgi:competence protein ComEC
MKVPHHGSENALNEGLYKRRNPKYAVVSVGKDNMYGHPHAELLNFMSLSGIKYFRTDETGDKKFISDGENIEPSEQRKILPF